MKFSHDWGIFEIKDKQVVSSYIIPGRPYNVQKEPTRYWVFAQYRPSGDIPFKLTYIKVNILPGCNGASEEDKVLVKNFIKEKLLYNVEVPIAFF